MSFIAHSKGIPVVQHPSELLPTLDYRHYQAHRTQHSNTTTADSNSASTLGCFPQLYLGMPSARWSTDMAAEGDLQWFALK